MTWRRQDVRDPLNKTPPTLLEYCDLVFLGSRSEVRRLSHVKICGQGYRTAEERREKEDNETHRG